MIQQFKSMNDLVGYLGRLEERVKTLEAENRNLQSITPAKETIDGNMIARYVSSSLPQTNILSHGFLKRAFAIWGHFFVANFIISSIVFIGYLCLMMAVFGSVLGGLPRTP